MWVHVRTTPGEGVTLIFSIYIFFFIIFLFFFGGGGCGGEGQIFYFNISEGLGKNDYFWGGDFGVGSNFDNLYG